MPSLRDAVPQYAETKFCTFVCEQPAGFKFLIHKFCRSVHLSYRP